MSGKYTYLLFVQKNADEVFNATESAIKRMKINVFIVFVPTLKNKIKKRKNGRNFLKKKYLKQTKSIQKKFRKN